MEQARARVFGSIAAQYHRFRPSYPDAALDWLLGDAQDVADVGAGTGKLTEALVARGLSVTAIEPDAEMLAELGQVVPAAHRIQAPAEDLPVTDGTLDAILIAQAWHWVDPDRAIPEIRRALRPGGRLGLVWNTVVSDQGWPAEVAALDPTPIRAGDWRPTEVGLPEDEVEHALFGWTWWLQPDELVACVATHSAYAVLPEAERAERLDRVRAVVERAALSEADEQGRLGWPHETQCVRWTP